VTLYISRRLENRQVQLVLELQFRRYGMANVVPDRKLVGEFLYVYQDFMLST
jgi:hypothetical protein